MARVESKRWQWVATAERTIVTNNSRTYNMRLTKSIVALSLLSAPFLGLVAAAGEKVEVEVLHEVECKRRSTKGDKIEVCASCRGPVVNATPFAEQ